MSIIVTILCLIISVQFFIFAYLKKLNSPLLSKGALKLPIFFTFNRLLVFGGIFTLMFLVRLYSVIYL